MCFLRRLSFISVLGLILATHARPADLFLSDPSEPIQHDPQVDDAYLNTDFLWSSNKLASVGPDLAIDPPAQGVTSETDTSLFTDFSSNLLATDSSDSTISSSACNMEGSLTDDFLQARDEGSCSNVREQQGISLPNLLDENFLPQGLGESSVEQTDQSTQGSESRQDGVGWAAYGLNIPASLRLEENPQLCPPEIFITSTIPVCNNPATGRITYETAKLYATMSNVVPCM